MKIALYHNLTSGGSKREAYEFTRQFVRHGHTLHLYSPSTADESFLPLTQIAQDSFRFNLQLIPERSGRLPLLRRYFDLIRLGRNLRRIRIVAQQIAEKIDGAGYDFVFAHHDQLVQSPYLFRYLKTRSVYYCAEPMREFYEPPIPRPYVEPKSTIERIQQTWYEPARWLQRKIIKVEDRRNIQPASLVVTNSRFSIESLNRAYGIRARLSYLGVDTEKFKPLHLSRENFVISVGAVSPFKGYDFLIEALSRLPESKRPRLVIAGNTASRSEVGFLSAMAQERSVTMDIRVGVSEDELVQLYNRARALVYAPVLEPFGFAPLEAMACETPPVGVQEGGVGESVMDGVTGFLTPRDPAKFANALERVMSDCQLARSFGEKGRAKVLSFWIWDRAYERFLENLKA